ncbi:hypothetical protein PV797_17030 [Clostridiaceae bacterium M8S5]|nr:hypothetical protein PV797_17030 [Clostridiaceae bacterium M8S5]
MSHYSILIFFGLFAIISSIIYAVCPRKQRYIALLVLSIVFYGYFCGTAIIYLITTIVSSYFATVIMDKIPLKYDTSGLEKAERKKLKAKIKAKKRRVLIIYAIINIGILLVLKYFNFFAAAGTGLIGKLGKDIATPVIKIVLPLGISYYTLQALSYVIDVCRGKYPAEKNILKIALFISFFTQLHEGPFGRYDKLMPAMSSGEQITSKNLYNGIARLMWGFFKIFMVANRAAIISDAVFKDYKSHSGFTVIIATLAFTVQLYAEFSGYIDMASGIAKIFGIEFAKNFDMPFIAQNVAEFWRRWHISLGAWFRDYVFYPISTSKTMFKLNKKMKPVYADFIIITVALFVVWFLTGLWHGASFKYIAYGLYYFVLMVIYNILSPLALKVLEKYKIDSKNKVLTVLKILKTLIFVGIGMLMFRAENLSVFKEMLYSVFDTSKASMKFLIAIDTKDLILLLVSFLIMIMGAVLKMKNIDVNKRYNELSSLKKYWICFAVFCIIIVFGAYGLGYLPPDPIYGGF